MKPPAFQFYPDDFIGGTCDMSTKEVGAFIRLICFQWTKGKIPDDEKKLARIAGSNVTLDVLAKFPNGMNQRLERERCKQDEYRAKQAAKGQLSALARSNRGSTVVQPSREPEGNSPSPSPSSISNSTLPESAPPHSGEDVTKSKREPKPKKEKPTDPRFREFIGIFDECYRTAFDSKWVMAKGKDGKHLKDLLAALPDLTAETWREALEWCQDTAQKEGRYAPKIIATGNLAAFCSNWSGIVAYSQTYQEPKK